MLPMGRFMLHRVPLAHPVLVSTTLMLASACGPDVSSHSVIIHSGSALLVAVDPLADGQWLRLAPQSEVEVVVGPRWLTASVGGPSDQIAVVVRAHSGDEMEPVVLPFRVDDPSVVSVSVTVTGSSRANVQIGAHGALIEDGNGSLFARPGRWDILATDAPGTRAVLLRDVLVEENGAVLIDFTGDGFALEGHDVTVEGGLGPVQATAYLTLSGETSVVMPSPSADATVFLIPNAHLLDTDTQWVSVVTSDGVGHSNGCSISTAALPLVASLPETVEAEVTLDPVAASRWSLDEDWDDASLHAFSMRDEGEVTLWSWNYYDARAVYEGSILFPDLSQIPGWNSSWELPGDEQRRVSVVLSRDDCQSGWSVPFPPM